MSIHLVLLCRQLAAACGGWYLRRRAVRLQRQIAALPPYLRKDLGYPTLDQLAGVIGR